MGATGKLYCSIHLGRHPAQEKHGEHTSLSLNPWIQIQSKAWAKAPQGSPCLFLIILIPLPCHMVSVSDLTLHTNYYRMLCLTVLGVLVGCPSWVKVTTTLCGLALYLLDSYTWLLVKCIRPRISSTPFPSHISLSLVSQTVFIPQNILCGHPAVRRL